MKPELQRIAIAEACLIPLTKGFSATIDAADEALVSSYKWRVKQNGRTNYAISDTGGKRVWMHRIILGVSELVDHRDNDGLNNQRSNLRVISNTNNIRRKRPNLRGSSRFKGVSWYHRTKKWQSSIKVDGRSIALGHYVDEVVAAQAYDSAAKLHFGENSFLNFP